MSPSLQDIFDEPVNAAPLPPRASVVQTVPNGDDSDDDDMTRPSKRARSSLFLDDPDDLELDPPQIQNDVPPDDPPGANPDIDALFAEVEEDANQVTTTSKPFDLDAYRREAQRRAQREINENPPSSSFAQYAVQSSSPPPEGPGDKEGEGRKDSGKGPQGRRPMAKLDEARLLGKDGFPALVQQCKAFNPRGKGHEQADLNKLISLYQFWTHSMFAKFTFNDTVSRVEKICRSRRMMTALSVWKDEMHGTINRKKVDDDDGAAEMGSEDGSDDEGRPLDRELPIASSSRAPSTAPHSDDDPHMSSPPPSRPPSSASELGHAANINDDDDLFDFDAFMDAGTSHTSPDRPADGTATAAQGDSMQNRPSHHDKDETDMWAEIEGNPYVVGDEPTSPTRKNDGRVESQPPSRSTDDDDEMMWDVLDEMEHEKTQNQSHNQVPNVRSGQTFAVPNVGTGKDPEWDDMYV